MDNLKTVIGIEMHCELKSNSKVFSSGKNAYSDEANTNVSPVDMAFPGILPVTNKKCVMNAIKMAKILHCQIADKLIFDRKNYYYPDLPKGYQITQCHKPIGINGYIEYEVKGEIKKALIHDLHLEEDAASLDHFFNTSTIDYNRAGVPLIEIVTEPCFNSSDEVVAFLENLRRIYQYTDISDADTKRGQIRCDVNISLWDNNKQITPRVEVKNVNGFNNIADTIKFEVNRQKDLLQNNKLDELVQETRRFDEESGTTIRMRTKVDAIDYKYFIEPNLPPYIITNEWIDEIIKEIPKLPLERKLEYQNNYQISTEDANTLIKDKNVSDYYEKCIELGIDPKIASNWITVNILGYLNKENISIQNFYLKPELLKQIIDAINTNKISSKQAKEIFNKAIDEKQEPNNYIKESNQISDKDELITLIKNIINNNQEQKQAYLNGKTNLFDYFVGLVMKETKGKANPTITKEILLNELNN